MRTLTFLTWGEFQSFITDYCRHPLERRRQLLFRGQSSALWKLVTTLDREHPAFPSNQAREDFFANLLRRFRRESLQLDREELWQLQGDALEFKARHHGLPTPIIDWSESPYIAAYFAFANASPSKHPTVAIWVLDRALLADDLNSVTIIDDEALLARNRRAIHQRGVVMRVKSVTQPLEAVLESALTKLEMPAAEAAIALAHLDEMTITETTLFGDLDAAASAVSYRELRSGG